MSHDAWTLHVMVVTTMMSDEQRMRAKSLNSACFYIIDAPRESKRQRLPLAMAVSARFDPGVRRRCFSRRINTSAQRSSRGINRESMIHVAKWKATAVSFNLTAPNSDCSRRYRDWRSLATSARS